MSCQGSRERDPPHRTAGSSALTPSPRREAALDWDTLARLARRIARSRFGLLHQDAEDIAQEALLRLLQVPEPRDPDKWIATVVRNLVIDLWRRPRFELPLQLDVTQYPSAQLEHLLDTRLILSQVFPHLTTAERVVAHGLLQGLKHREIAAFLRCPASQVGIRVRRIRTKIARLCRNRRVRKSNAGSVQ